MNLFKTLLVSNIIIMVLIIPGFILLDNYLSASGADTISTTQSVYSADIIPDEIKENKISNTPSKLIDPTIKIDPECLVSNFNFKWDIIKGKEKVEKYQSKYPISFGSSSEYNKIEGVTTFRGNNYRNSASYGYVDVKEEKLEKVWSVNVGHIDIWTGVGWNGQPSIVKWDNNLKKKMNLFSNKSDKEDLKEVIYGALDGKIYFLDLDDGSKTRSQINIGAPIKGSITVDPRGYPLLYAGQGIDEVNEKKVKIGFYIFNLLNQRQLYFLNGIDLSSYRYWGAFDSTPLIHKESDTLFECGENSMLYSIKLNTMYDSVKGIISIAPDETKYRYLSPFKRSLGIESSIAAYKNLGYFTDNGGALKCVDLNTLSPVWIRDVTDDSDSTIAIEEHDKNNVMLYTANEVDLQGENGYSYVRKINALTGELKWEKKYQCTYNSETNGGALASPVIGKNDIDNLVIYNIAKSYKKNGSKLIAFDKETGTEIWVINFDRYSWSSPVDIYTKDGKSYILQSDSAGYMYLIEGISGRILDKIPLEANIEGSPAVYDNMLVVGTRGQKIWGIKIK